MRLDIYDFALLDTEIDPNASISTLLQSCKQINMEAQPALYKRPTSFKSQINLFAWIDRSRRSNLNRVRTLTLRLTDVDLTPLFDRSSPSRRSKTNIFTLYETELRRLDDAFAALSNLTNLTIVPPRICQSQLLKGLYYSFLALLPRRCPKLSRLEVHDAKDILEAVPALKNVANVVFMEPAPKTRDRKSDTSGADEEEDDTKDDATSSEAISSPRIKIEELPLQRTDSKKVADQVDAKPVMDQEGEVR